MSCFTSSGNPRGKSLFDTRIPVFAVYGILIAILILLLCVKGWSYQTGADLGVITAAQVDAARDRALIWDSDAGVFKALSAAEMSALYGTEGGVSVFTIKNLLSGQSLFQQDTQGGSSNYWSDGSLAQTINSGASTVTIYYANGNKMLEGQAAGEQTGITLYNSDGQPFVSPSGLFNTGAASFDGQVAATSILAGVSPMSIHSDTTLTIDQTRSRKFFVDGDSSVTLCPLSSSPISGNTIFEMKFFPMDSGISIWAHDSDTPIYVSTAGPDGGGRVAYDCVFINAVSGTILGVDAVVTGVTKYWEVYFVKCANGGTTQSGETIYGVGDGGE